MNIVINVYFIATPPSAIVTLITLFALLLCVLVSRLSLETIDSLKRITLQTNFYKQTYYSIIIPICIYNYASLESFSICAIRAGISSNTTSTMIFQLVPS